MLVRDIPLIRAIIDLVDNSLDGARQIREKNNFDGLSISLDVNKDYFMISDNCGGIKVSTARNFAFNFGRPKDAPPTPGSIGKFGIGMKRAFFKLGKYFEVTSYTNDSYFILEQDVEKWIEKGDDWHFKFKDFNENFNEIDPNKIGTEIKVSRLHENISKEFELDNFLNQLAIELAHAHSISIDSGLKISLNGIPVNFKPIELLNHEELKPVHLEITSQKPNEPPVNIRIYAGIADRSIQKGGWYIFCNGRMLLEADQNLITGWGEGNGKTIPKYHPDFAYFRGYVFFDSENAGLLPWTTTKTGVDSDSPIYKSARLKMITITRPILDFLRALASEKKDIEDGKIESAPLEAARERANLVKYSEIKVNKVFVAPNKATKKPGPELGKISYSKPKSDITKIRNKLNLSSNKAVGEKTFDYYKEIESEE